SGPAAPEVGAAGRNHPAAPAAGPAVVAGSHPADPWPLGCPPRSAVVHTGSGRAVVDPAAPFGWTPHPTAHRRQGPAAPIRTAAPPESTPVRHTGRPMPPPPAARRSGPDRAVRPGSIPAHRTESVLAVARSAGTGTAVVHRPQAGSVAAENSCGLRTPLTRTWFLTLVANHAIRSGHEAVSMARSTS